MSIYEFECKICGTRLDREVTETDETHCNEKLRRLYNVTAHYKGPGFYVNDKKRQYK